MFLFFAFLFACGLFYEIYWKRKNLPPGPVPLPFFGNTLSFRNNQLEKCIRTWHKIYGDLMTICIGNEPVVTLHDSSTIYETFLKDGDAYTDRAQSEVQNILRKGNNGIAFIDGSKWREQRRFSLQVLRNFGLGKNLMQERILVEVTGLISDIKQDLKNNIKEIALPTEIDRAVGSIINMLTFGYRYGKENMAEFLKVKEYATTTVGYHGDLYYKILEMNFDMMKHFPIFNRKCQELYEKTKEISNFFEEKIEEHRRKMDFESNEDPVDYTEAYLRHQYKLKKEGNEGSFTDNQLYGMVLDLWVAGQETTSNTLAWLCLYLLNRPDIQQKVHEELDKFVGSDRIVTLDDKINLNYVNAIVAETQRFCNLGPFNIIHKTTKEVNIHGYRFPKGTLITHQIGTVLNDDRYFKNPDEFIPERFLDKNGRFFSPPELMPFGIGKRACLGEGLAKMELYLFAANIFNQFKLTSKFGKFSEERINKGSICCKPYKCEIQSRF